MPIISWVWLRVSDGCKTIFRVLGLIGIRSWVRPSLAQDFMAALHQSITPSFSLGGGGAVSNLEASQPAAPHHPVTRGMGHGARLAGGGIGCWAKPLVGQNVCVRKVGNEWVVESAEESSAIPRGPQIQKIECTLKGSWGMPLLRK